ncbi:MAG: exostosin family protein [Opitutus sp.]
MRPRIRSCVGSTLPVALRCTKWWRRRKQRDFVFISNLPLDVDQRALRNHPLFLRFLHKTYALWDSWNTPFLLPGIYVNATRGSGLGRFRTGSYALHHPDFKNPYIQAFTAAASPERRPDLLFSFLGRNCHPCRAQLFSAPKRREDVWLEDTSRFDAFSHAKSGKDDDQRRYLEICLRSEFILCPRGVGASSIRLFEALRLGIAPIIISDAWKPCVGPDWKRGAIFIKEADVGRVEEIVATYEPRWQEMGAAARAIHDAYFAESAYFNFLVDNVRALARHRVVPERMLAWTWPLQVSMYKTKSKLSSVPRGRRLAYVGSRALAKAGIKVRPATSAR